MKITKINYILIMYTAVFIANPSANANSVCTDANYRVFQKYDKFLDENPSIKDEELRVTFAKRLNVKPNDLKQIYMRCTSRWANENPKEANDLLMKQYKENPSAYEYNLKKAGEQWLKDNNK